MKKNIVVLFFSISVILMLITRCGSDSSASVSELEQLKNQIKEDSIFRESWAAESRKIDALLSDIAGFTTKAQGGSLQDDDLLAKASSVQSLIEEANERIAQLEKEASVQKSSSKKIPELLLNLKKQKANIMEQDSLIQVLQKRVKDGEVKIAELDSKVNLQGKTIEEQQAEINKKVAELQRKEQQLADGYRELENTKRKATEDLKKQQNSFRITAGLEKISAVELAKGMLPEKKKQLLGEAWDYFCQAHKGGDYNALTEMNKLQSNKDLSKFVKDKSCN